jgi:hypothetical protein
MLLQSRAVGLAHPRYMKRHRTGTTRICSLELRQIEAGRAYEGIHLPVQVAIASNMTPTRVSRR